jgi:hypothetical protein
VLDNVAPNAVCQNLTVQLDASGNASITPAQVNNGSTDACGIASLSLNDDNFNCADVGGLNIADLFISQYAEGSGNNKCIEIYNGTGSTVSLAGYQILVYFNGSATAGTTINLSGNLASGDVHVVCSSSASAAFLALADQTTGASLWNGDDAIVLANNGNAIDIFGRIGQDPGAAWTQGSNSTVDRTLTRLGSVTMGNTTNVAGFPALGTEWSSLAQDATTGFGSHSVTASGTSVILTVTDINGNSSTCTAAITVQDNVAPNAICQNVTVQLDAAGNGSTSASAVDNGSNDACGIQSLSLSPTAFTCANVGANTVTLTVTDVNGNVSTCTATATVQDNVAPVALCQGTTINLGSSGSVTVAAATINNGSSDACGIASLSLSPNTFTCNNLGSNTVTLTVTDVNGNSSTCTAVVTVTTDPLVATLSSPTFQCGYNISCNGNSDGSIASAVTGGCLPYSYAWSNGGNTANLGNLAAGTYTVTVTDANGITTTATITLTQPDALTISLSSPTYNGGWNISCNGNNDGSINATTAGGATCQGYAYNWSGPNGFSSNVEDPSLLYAGTYNVTVMDANGCNATASITLTEPAPLVADAGNNVTVYYGYTTQFGCTTLNGTQTGGTPAYNGTWSANGSTVGTGFSTTVCPSTSTTYYYTVVDANGCTYTDSVRVCVIDVRCVGTSNNGNNGGNTGGQGGQGWINGNAPQHVTVCHTPPGQPGTSWIMCLPPNAVPAHLAHGDYLGACGVANTFVCEFPQGPAREAGNSAGAAVEEIVKSDLRMRAFPNPTYGEVKVELVCTECADRGEFEVQLVTLQGQTLNTTTIELVGGEGIAEFDLGSLSAGFYFIVVNNGEQRFVEKIMKN